MARTIVRGIVTRVESIDKHLSFVTLTPAVTGDCIETRVPLYMTVGKEYEGRAVDVITERTGFLGMNFKQTLECTNMSSVAEMPYSFVKSMNAAYVRSQHSKTE